MRIGLYRFWLLLLLFPAAARSETFKNPQLIPTSSSPGSVAQGDLNGDDQPDLIYADVSGYTSTLHILLNQGNRSFSPGENIVGPTSNPFAAITVADVNGDGTPDLVSVFSDSQTPMLAVALGNGDGTFQPLLTSPLPSYPLGGQAVVHALAVADINGDDKQDIIFSDIGNSVVSICLGDGLGHFTQWQELNDQNPAYAIFLGDFNRDGKTDIILYESDAARAAVYLNVNNAGFTLSPYVKGPQGIVGMAVKDMDADGYMDMVINGQDDVLRILHGNADATFTATLSQPVPVGTSIDLPGILDVEDYNHDGILDLALASNDGVHILVGQGNFQFTPLPPAILSGPPGLGAIGDLDQDTYIDFAFPVPGGLAVLYGQPDGALRSADSYDMRYLVRGAALADFNGDGRPDAIVSVNDLYPRLLTGNANGTFTLQPDRNTPMPSIHDQGFITTGDINGDGHADYLSSIGTADLNQLHGAVYALGNGDGTFGTPNSVPGYTEEDALATAVGDLNHDGRTDVAASEYGSTQQAFFLGQSDGSLQQSATLVSTFASAPQWAYGDFNKDGYLDAAMVGGGEIQIENGNGDGTFAPGFVYTAGASPTLGSPAGVIAVDIDGDGNLDILAPIDFAIQAFYGNGDGTFSPPVYIALDQPPAHAYLSASPYSGINAADFDGDGILDLVLTNGDMVTILHGMGGRHFSASKNYLGGYSTAAPAIGDFNGDGRPDVLIVNLAASTVTVLLNKVPEADVAGKLTVTPEPSTFPQSFSLNLSLHAAVPASAVPSGTVVFRLDGTPLGNAAISNGSASFLVNTQVPVGMHELTASYSGDSTFQPGTFAARHTVIPAVVPTPTATGLASAPNPAQVGTNVTFTASVTNTTTGAAYPSGNVTFSDGSTALGQSALNNNGVATFITNALAVGTHSITASYAGTNTTQPSVSSTVQQVIVAILGDFSLDVTPDTASIDTGAAQSFNVTVSAIGGFNQSVALSCSGLPSETTCVFKPASVPGGSGLSQLTIQTSSSHSIKAAGNSVPLPWKPLAATSASLSLAVLLLPRRTRVLRRYLTLVICLLLTVAMGACGGSGPAGGGTPPGTYNVSINGTASSLTHSIPVALTVK